jgi:hypothetical protein
MVDGTGPRSDVLAGLGQGRRNTLRIQGFPGRTTAHLYGALRERLRTADRLIHRRHRLYYQDPEFATCVN